jgi:hypothetical protein
MQPAVRALIEELIPTSVVFDGADVSANAIKWVGTESGMIAGPIWSTGVAREGNPDAGVYVPTGCDTVITTPHTWFAIEVPALLTTGFVHNTHYTYLVARVWG